MKFRFNDLAHFIETASCSTITEASKKLEISQPALSESLKRLEKDLKYQLFYRSRSGIQLTPSGKAFLTKSKQLTQSLNDLEELSSDNTTFAGRCILIGCHPTVAQYTIPQAVLMIKNEAPDYKIEIIHDLSRNIQFEIQRGRIDIGIVINPMQVPDLVISPLASDTVGVWAINTSKNFDTVICNPDLFQTQSILRKWKLRPKRLITTTSLELIARMTNQGIGYGIIPERAVKLSGFDLKRLNQLPTYKDEICLVYRPEFGTTTAEKLVKNAIKRSLT